MTDIHKRVPAETAEQIQLCVNMPGFIETIKGINQMRVSGLDHCMRTLIDKLITYRRSELLNLQDHILPNTGMGLNHFISWFAFSPFGRTICAMSERANMTYQEYCWIVKKYYLANMTEDGKQIVSPTWGTDNETFLKQMTCLVLLAKVEKHGRGVFHPLSEQGKLCAKLDHRVLEKIQAFGEGTISEARFFQDVNAAHQLFTPAALFYNEMLQYAGLIIDTKLK